MADKPSYEELEKRVRVLEKAESERKKAEKRPSENGEVAYYEGVVVDITKRKQAEKALRESEQRHRRLFETMAQGVIYQAADGVIISANPAAQRILGLPFDQMRGKTSMDPRWKMIREDGSTVPGTEHPAMVAIRTGRTVGPVIRGVFHPERNAHAWLSITAIPLFHPGETVPYQAYATFEDIHLVWQPGADLWPVNMDLAQIDQILANLCVNARDAIVGVGKVTIETGNVTLDEDDCNRYLESVPGDYVLLAVSDNGCGMDREVLGKLYEPFFTTKEVGKGTGLGLPTVYGIVKQNEGFINVYSEPGQGTTFRIYIPRHKGEAEMEQKQTSDKLLPGGHETILLVEDESTLLKMEKAMLETLGYKVLPADTPAEAVRIAAEHKEKIHLLITDVIMPEMNGGELAERLSADFPNMKLLFMSGYTADVIAHHGVLDPGVKFVQKPFSMKDLAKKIREALEI